MSNHTGDSPSWEDRLEQAQAGDAAAFWELVEPCRPYLMAVVTHILRDRRPSDGPDVLSDGLIHARENVCQFRGSCPDMFNQWLTTIVRRRALKLLGKRDFGQLREDSNGEVQVPGGSSGPVDKASRRETAARVHAAVDRLPDRYKMVIQLYYFESLTYPEIATLMELSQENVRQLCHRALKKLKAELGDLS